MTIWRRIKRFITPHSLYGRFLMMIMMPIVLSQLVMGYVFYERHWKSLHRNLARSLADEMLVVVEQYDNDPILSKDIATKMHIDFKVHNTPPKEKMGHQRPLRHLKTKLDEKIKQPYYLHEWAEGYMASFPVQPGEWLSLYVSDKRLSNPTKTLFIWWMIGTATLLTIIALLFLRTQVRSIVRLTHAAEKFGKGHDAPRFKPEGAREVRAAGISFLQMRERIKRLLMKRTEMLAAISHDLKTPLTRMKLGLSFLEGNKRVEALQEDVIEMELMLQEYLDFVRDNAGEKTEDIEMRPFMDKLLQPYLEKPLEVDLPKNLEKYIVHGKPFGLRRALTNIIENALRYAEKANIKVKQTDIHHIGIIVDDNGRGIPEASRNEVFLPFFRMDSSRNADTGGVGLGLSIARDIVLTHGGRIWLEDSPMGGLRVVVELPV